MDTVLWLILVPAFFFGMGFYVSKLRVGKKPTKVEDPTKQVLHGHDLSKWNYLGYNEFSYADDDGKITSSYPIFFFTDKNDTNKRSYHIATTNDYVKNNHSYISRHVKPWAAGEYQFYELVRGDKAYPSSFLKNYMLENYKCEWDNTKHWWKTSEKAKYDAAKNKQKKAEKKDEDKPESNVIPVDFGKDK